MPSSRAVVPLPVATIAMGLLAGLFYAYACSVMPGLGASADSTFVDAMQQINKGIENPVFFATFLGAPAAALWALANVRRADCSVVARWVVAALALYAVGFLITCAFNTPLNEELKRAGTPRGAADTAAIRDRFETAWLTWNIARTFAVTAAFCCLVYALSLQARRPEMN